MQVLIFMVCFLLQRKYLKHDAFIFILVLVMFPTFWFIFKTMYLRISYNVFWKFVCMCLCACLCFCMSGVMYVSQLAYGDQRALMGVGPYF